MVFDPLLADKTAHHRRIRERLADVFQAAVPRDGSFGAQARRSVPRAAGAATVEVPLAIRFRRIRVLDAIDESIEFVLTRGPAGAEKAPRELRGMAGRLNTIRTKLRGD